MHNGYTEIPAYADEPRQDISRFKYNLKKRFQFVDNVIFYDKVGLDDLHPTFIFASV